jgi:hypothetical protein
MWKKFKKRVNSLPPVLRNIYFIALVLFAIWMVFIDDNNLVSQYRRHHELSVLNSKKKFYLDQIAQTQKEYNELTSNPETQEKFAREHYWMKRDNEDVFVIVQKHKSAE